MQRGSDDITIEAEPAIELAGGRLKGLYLCRAKALTALYVRKGSEGEMVLVTATAPEQALLKIERAIDSGEMIRRAAGAGTERSAGRQSQ